MVDAPTPVIAHPMPAVDLLPGNLAALDLVQALLRASAVHGQGLQLLRDDARHSWIDAVGGPGRPSGVVLAHLVEGDERITLLRRRGVPYVCLGRPASAGIPDQDDAWVDVDNVSPVRAATEHLLENGHRRIHFLGYDTDAYWDDARVSGYGDAMRAAGLEPQVFHSQVGTVNEHAAAAQVLGTSPPPTAVVTGSDVLAAAVYAVAGRTGRLVGSDLAVTGFDGGVLSRLLGPSLTTAAVPIDEVAMQLVADLVAQVGGARPAPGRMLDVPLRLGDSSDVALGW